MKKSDLLQLAEQLEEYQDKPQGHEWDKQLKLFEAVIENINIQIAMFAPLNRVFEYSIKGKYDLEDGDSITLSLNAHSLHIKADSKCKNFVVSTLNNNLLLTPDARNKIFISAEKQKL